MRRKVVSTALSMMVVVTELLNCSAAENGRAMDRAAVIRSQLARSAKTMVDLTNPRDLVRSPEFRFLFLRSDEHYGVATELLRSDVLSGLEESILVLAMQNLPDDAYMTFLESCLAAFKAGDIDDRTLRLALFPGPEWNDVFARESLGVGPRRFLDALVLDASVPPDMRSFSQFVLDGGLAEGTRAWIRRGDFRGIRSEIKELEGGVD